MSESASEDVKSLITTARNCINSYFLIPNEKNSTLEIAEPKNGQKLTIEDAHHNTSLCITLDKDRTKGEFDKALPFLNSAFPGITKKSDAIVLHYRDQVLYVIIIELKNKKTDYKQVKSSYLFSEYLIKLIQLHSSSQSTVNLTQIQFMGVFALQQRSAAKELSLDPYHADFPIFLYGEPTLKISALIQYLKRSSISSQQKTGEPTL